MTQITVMIGLNKFGTALTVVVVVALAALFAEIVYLLWGRRQTFQSRIETDIFLCFRCCWNKKSRVESQEACIPGWPCSTPETEEQEPKPVMKWQYLYGTSWDEMMSSTSYSSRLFISNGTRVPATFVGGSFCSRSRKRKERNWIWIRRFVPLRRV